MSVNDEIQTSSAADIADVHHLTLLKQTKSACYDDSL